MVTRALLPLPLVLGLTVAGRADITASTYLGGGTLGNFVNPTGFAFVPQFNITVNQLGVWDSDSDGLASAHTVGLFDSVTHASLTTALVPSGTAAPIIDGSRFVNITPIQLLAGTSYYILGDNFSTDVFAYGNTAIWYAPEITWLRTVNALGPTIFADPFFLNDNIRGDLGPNFLFTPSPGGMTTFAVSLAFGLRRHRKVEHGA